MNNKHYDTDHTLSILRELGSIFLKSYKSESIPEDEEAMFKLFRRIENDSITFLKSRLKTDIPFLEGELDTNFSNSSPQAKTSWLFDSMDGAVQYMRHLPGWTFNLALIVEGEIIFSALFDPLHDEMFWAEKGGGAFLDTDRISVKKRAPSSVMMAATSHPPFSNTVEGFNDKFAKSDKALLQTYSFLRNFGPTALQIAYVAAGRIDVYGQVGSDTFNWVPGILIAQEAGATVSTLSGGIWRWDSQSLLVGEASVVDQLLSQNLSLE